MSRLQTIYRLYRIDIISSDSHKYCPTEPVGREYGVCFVACGTVQSASLSTLTSRSFLANGIDNSLQLIEKKIPIL